MRASLGTVFSLVLICLSQNRDLLGAEPPSGAEIKALVDRLVSPNPTPRTFEDGVVAGYPPGYDRKAQEPVMQAFHSLRALGTSAFPYVIPRLGDARYSFVNDRGDDYFVESIGDVCVYILETQLMAYSNHYHIAHRKYRDGEDPFSFPRRPQYCRALELNDPQKAQAWWEARRHKSLRELQLEAIEWTIAEEAKRPRDFTDEERAYLQETLAELMKAERPLPPYYPGSR